MALSGRQTLDNASVTGILMPGLYNIVMLNPKHQRIIFWRRDGVSEISSCRFVLRMSGQILWLYDVPVGSTPTSVVQIWLQDTLSL